MIVPIRVRSDTSRRCSLHFAPDTYSWAETQNCDTSTSTFLPNAYLSFGSKHEARSGFRSAEGEEVRDGWLKERPAYGPGNPDRIMVTQSQFPVNC
jgi:hypothetical protein